MSSYYIELHRVAAICKVMAAMSAESGLVRFWQTSCEKRSSGSSTSAAVTSNAESAALADTQ
jgi:hypothetical protein